MTTESREDQRLVERGEENIRFALKWAEAMLRQRLSWASEAAVFVGEPRRTLDQNAKLWPMLEDVSEQVRWNDERLTREDWKDVFTAALRRYRAVPGIDGGMVFLGMRTSRMRKGEFSELIESIYAFGTERGVVWSEPAKQTYAKYGKRKAA